jgi:predicted histidine transporter YuiF (NhaC family)
MSFTTDPNVLIIYALIFVLGLLIGIFLTAGGRRKWRERYNNEFERRRELEKTHAEREKHWADQEKDWRERDSLRGAAVKGPPDDRPL